jgi:branched-chain amino acid transport system ATP-binding protein
VRAILELTHVEAGYGGHRVLRSVDLVVPDDAVVVLLGPNGAGKTTLLRVASGLLQPTAGTIQLDGTDVTHWAPHRLTQAGVCHVPEGRGIFTRLTVRDNLRLQATCSGPDAIERVVSSLPRLDERRTQTAGTLSGGEQQMLALAHAYVAEPSVVLADEVSMGLAPTLVDTIFEKLRELADRGAALLLVEQYISRALDLADYVYVLNKGRIVFAGESRELTGTDILESYLGEGVA